MVVAMLRQMRRIGAMAVPAVPVTMTVGMVTVMVMVMAMAMTASVVAVGPERPRPQPGAVGTAGRGWVGIVQHGGSDR